MTSPGSTYRFQFTPQFTFERARELVDYLKQLGITHIYASPVTRPCRGSSHGYDVCDPREVNPELGDPAELIDLLSHVRASGMGWIQDIVPNHMAYSEENTMLMDVLMHGEASRYFDFFDIEWDHQQESLRGRVLAPFLGRPLGECIEEGEIVLVHEKGRLHIGYYDRRFPVRPECYFDIFRSSLPELRRKLSRRESEYIRFTGVLYTLHNLPGAAEPEERYGQMEMALQIFDEAYLGNEEIRAHVDHVVGTYNHDGDGSSRIDLLWSLLDRQFYRLCFWRVAAEEINYRRFFTISDLIAVRIEKKNVFETLHSLIFGLADNGLIQGVRIDHIDGLFDPLEYLTRLRARCPGLYIVVEKILDIRETLPREWQVQGETGYQFLNELAGVLCRHKSMRSLNSLYRRFIRRPVDVEELKVDRKRLIISKDMTGDVDNLASLILHSTSHRLAGNDVTFYAMRRAIVELLVHFPVYRTYIDKNKFENRDMKILQRALQEVRRTKPEFEYEYRIIERFFTGTPSGSRMNSSNISESLMRFQQFTGPLMAKGYEDTFLYSYNRLAALNEVGGWPEMFGIELGEFHRYMKKRGEEWPMSLNATATHDTKRGEDTRCRMLAISEFPEHWATQVIRWRKNNDRFKHLLPGRKAPDLNDEYLLYQTIAGTLPVQTGCTPEYCERIKRYMLKAIREAKTHTAWIKPDSAYEESMMDFIDKILRKENEPFIKEARDFSVMLSWYGLLNSISQCLIKIAAPGVPDFFQGTELIEYVLVDPDNRRPVDYSLRKDLLGRIIDGIGDGRKLLLAHLLSSPNEAMVKMFVIYGGLQARKRNPELFLKGDYTPFEAGGRRAENVIAFRRCEGENCLIAIAPRCTGSLAGRGSYPIGSQVWGDTVVRTGVSDKREYTDIYSGSRMKIFGEVHVGELLEKFPVALWIHSQLPPP